MFLRGNTLNLNKKSEHRKKMLLLGPSRNFGTLNVWDFWLLHSLRNAEQHDFCVYKGKRGSRNARWLPAPSSCYRCGISGRSLWDQPWHGLGDRVGFENPCFCGNTLKQNKKCETSVKKKKKKARSFWDRPENVSLGFLPLHPLRSAKQHNFCVYKRRPGS